MTKDTIPGETQPGANSVCVGKQLDQTEFVTQKKIWKQKSHFKLHGKTKEYFLWWYMGTSGKQD
jgi:hypothetical protein